MKESCSISCIQAGEEIELDELDADSIKQMFDADKWAKWVVEIEVTSEKWLEGLKERIPYTCDF